MKAKLLRKIRKRYGWYFTSDDDLVLVDNHKKECTFINKKFLSRHYAWSEDDFLLMEISMKELKWRCGKDIMLNSFGRKYADVFYNITKRKSEKRGKH